MRFFENDTFQAQLVDVRHLADLKNVLASLTQQQAFDAEFYRTHLQDFETISKDAMPAAKSLMVVACKDPAVRFTFTHAGRTISLLVPPTYLFAQRKVQETVQFFDRLLEAQGYHIAQALVPKKLLAVCSGLAEYGKNNISYVQGFGSYHRLATFFCDMECNEDTWREPVTMERCQTCKACTSSCPTGAIDPQRFLLHAERCMTYFNEMSADTPFPAWVNKEWQDCLVGCMRCQSICPANEGKEWIEESGIFSEEETGILLAGKKQEEIPDSLRKKLADCDLLDMLDVIPRNLGAFFNATSS